MKKKKDKLYKIQNGKCFYCENQFPIENLLFEHIVPIAYAGTEEEENIVLACYNCNARMASRMPFREIEFLIFIRELLNSHPDFKFISQEAKISPELRYRADLFAEEKVKGKWKNVLIEIKSMPTFTSKRLREVVEQLNNYKELIDKETKIVLCFPGLIPKKDIEYLKEFDIAIWDRDFIIKKFSSQISHSKDKLFRKFFVAKSVVPKIEDSLLDELKNIKAGRKEWSKYQNQIGKILSYLFSDILSDPITELSDKYGINRRDFILRNYSEGGFWKYLREKYQADFIVIDAKNYTGKVKKNQILQISNYLKSHGAGLFAIIISRNGEEDKGAYFTRREKWSTENKMIIILSDDDMEKMILAKSSSNLPEEIIIQKIEGFRLEM